VGDMITVKDVSFCYGTGENPQQALDGINLTVAKGEYLAVIGHNGSGKSTLAKHFNALLNPRTGRSGWTACPPGTGAALRDPAAGGDGFSKPRQPDCGHHRGRGCGLRPREPGAPPPGNPGAGGRSPGTGADGGHAPACPPSPFGRAKAAGGHRRGYCHAPPVPGAGRTYGHAGPPGPGRSPADGSRLNREEGITVLYITHFMEEVRQADNLVVMDQGRIVLTGASPGFLPRGTYLRSLGLEVPPVTELAQRLKNGACPSLRTLWRLRNWWGRYAPRNRGPDPCLYAGDPFEVTALKETNLQIPGGALQASSARRARGNPPWYSTLTGC
jgi:energy-coupling factor transport system ATP-binding protein